MTRRGVLPALFCLVALALPPSTDADELAKEPRGPLRLLDFAIEDKAVRRVVEAYTISRALDPVRFVGRREHEEFLLERLPLAAALGRHLHPPLEPYNVTEKGPGQDDIDDRGAIRGHLRLIAQAPRRRVYLAEGEFRSLAHLIRFKGAMVIALRYAEEAEAGEPALRNEPHLYVRIDNALVHGLLKLLSPLIHGIIDRRVATLAAAAEAVSARITNDPAELYREMKGWPDVTDAQLAAFRGQFGLPDD